MAWKALGATHISFNTMNSGLTSPKDLIESITRFKSLTLRKNRPQEIKGHHNDDHRRGLRTVDLPGEL